MLQIGVYKGTQLASSKALYPCYSITYTQYAVVLSQNRSQNPKFPFNVLTSKLDPSLYSSDEMQQTTLKIKSTSWYCKLWSVS